MNNNKHQKVLVALGQLTAAAYIQRESKCPEAAEYLETIRDGLAEVAADWEGAVTRSVVKSEKRESVN